MAHHGDRASGETAQALLRKAEAQQAPGTKDAESHTELGFLDQEAGDIPTADREYRAALDADSNDGTARGDLAVLFAETGDYATAVHLWQQVFNADPAQAAAGYNLALGQCRLGQKGRCRGHVETAADLRAGRSTGARVGGGPGRRRAGLPGEMSSPHLFSQWQPRPYPSPFGHRRTPRKSLCCYVIGSLPRVKIVFPNDLPLNSSIYWS